MKRTRDALMRLNGAKEDSLRRLEPFAPDSAERRERIFERSEERLMELEAAAGSVLPQTGARSERAERVEVKSAPKWFTPLKAAAACAVLLVIGGAAFGVLRGSAPTADGAESAESGNIASGAPQESAAPDGEEAETAARLPETDSSKDEKSASDTGSAAGSKTESKTESKQERKAESKTESGAASSAAQSTRKPEAQSSIPPVPMPAEDISSRQDQSEGSGRAVRDPNGEEIDIAPEDPENSEPAGVCGVQSEEPGEINVQIGVTDSEKVMKITPEMSYAQVIELLGTPNDVLTDSYGQYIVDGDYLLMLDWDFDTDPVLRSGSELLAGCPRISEMLSSPETQTFDCCIVNYNGAAIRVTCPQYSRFDCATVNIHTGDNAREWTEIVERAMSDGKPLRITHEDYVLESYPPIVTPISIEIAP